MIRGSQTVSFAWEVTQRKINQSKTVANWVFVALLCYPVHCVIYHFGISFNNIEDKLTVPGYSSDKRKSVTR